MHYKSVYLENFTVILDRYVQHMYNHSSPEDPGTTVQFIINKIPFLEILYSFEIQLSQTYWLIHFPNILIAISV